MIFFTSKTYKTLFVQDYEEFIDIVNKPLSLLYNNQAKGDTTMRLLTFFMIVVAIEHYLLFLKLYLEEVIDDNPKWIIRGV
jgi:hypothetical protein